MTFLSEKEEEDVLLDADALLARVVAKTSLSIPQDCAQCLMFLHASGCSELAQEYLQMRDYLSPATPQWMANLMEALALKKYMSRIQIALGQK